MAQPTYTPNDPFWSGYAGESQQGKEYLDRYAMRMPYNSSDLGSKMPESVDPRSHDLFNQGFMRIEMQGGVGACAGYSDSLCLEAVYGILTGEVVQLSPMYAYLMAQKFDGINGDRGSTLAGCTQVNKTVGLPPLKAFPLERTYPRGGYRAIPDSAHEAAKKGPFKCHRVVKFRNPSEYRAFIASNAGIAQTGTRWTKEMGRPGSHGVIESVGGRSYGGHAWNFVGYMPIDLMGGEAKQFVPRTRSEIINIASNSHSVNYGDRGFMYFTDELFMELLRGGDQILGRTDMPDIKPRPSKLDFRTAAHSRFAPNRLT